MKLALVVVSAVLMLSSLCAGDDCNIVCSREYNPVCGKGGAGTQMTFSNNCMMNYYNCLKGTDFSVLQQGECPGGQS